MEKIYLVVSRKYDGSFAERVRVNCTVEEAKNVGKLMLHTKAIKYEIYEDGKDYMGDFRIKPIYVSGEHDGVK